MCLDTLGVFFHTYFILLMSWVSFLVDQCWLSVDDVTILHLILTLVYSSDGRPLVAGLIFTEMMCSMEKVSPRLQPMILDIRMPGLAADNHREVSGEDAIQQYRKVLLFPSLRSLI